MIFKDGSEYIGQFIDDQADGHGLYTDASGNRYESLIDETNKKSGSFSHGKLYGYVQIRFKNGSTYLGDFKDGKISGHGECKFTNLHDESGSTEDGTYIGQWNNGKRHGLGNMKWRDGTHFEGYWSKDNRLNGKMTMSGGIIYEGPFQNDVFHGLGKLRISHSKYFEANFVNGFAPKYGKMTFSESGDVYEGYFEEFKMQGQGLMKYSNGNTYDGSWINNQRHGFGSIKYSNDDMYIGNWAYDKRSGLGKEVIEAKQLYFEGEYINDLRNGSFK